jgi:hypothetical protein
MDAGKKLLDLTTEYQNALLRVNDSQFDYPESDRTPDVIAAEYEATLRILLSDKLPNDVRIQSVP